MQKRIILNKYFFLILILFLSFLLSNFALACTTNDECEPGKCVDEKCVRALEIKYPPIPGATTPETVATGLPEYVNYIFQLSIILIGLIIFSVLIYNGVMYLTSAGDPTKMSDAKAGILAGFLGTIILLSAYLIFHTINPQLTILKMEEIPVLKPIVYPGIYICANKVDNIEGVLNKYLQGDRVEAVEELREIIEDKICLKANFSGNFENFEVTKNGNTFFLIPEEKSEYVSGTTVIKYVSKYGLILHQKDNFSGKCHIAFQENDKIYIEEFKETFKPISGNFNDLDFTARSFTLFKKPVPEPASSAKGVILCNCYTCDQTGCIGDVEFKGVPFPTGGADMIEVTKSGLGVLLIQKTYALKIDPKGSFLALIFDEDNFEENSEKCEVISSNVADLTQHPIGRCGNCKIAWMGYLWNVLNFFNPTTPLTEDCYPCIQSMIVIMGLKL